MIITTELAQQIVDHIMPLVQQNVNIMNSSAMIVGSGQKARINTYHQGASDVIRSGNVVEIYPDDLERYPGSLPGLNWPIVLGEQIVGVVGISGHPEAVRSTAKLVKMVTELLLERESLMEEFRSNLQLREQFIQLLLSERHQDALLQIKNIASLLRFDLSLPRLVAVLNVRTIFDSALSQYGTHDLVTSRTRETLTQLLDASCLVTAKDLFVLREDELIILKHFPADAPLENYRQWSLDILNLLDSDRQVCLGLGSVAPEPAEICHSYKEASFARNHPAAASGLASIYDFNILVAYLIKEPNAINTCFAFKRLRNTVNSRLVFKYDMQNTINTLLDHNLNVSSAAKALFVHRNTLVFRLEKLKELTGLCPSQFLNHALLCKILFSR